MSLPYDPIHDRSLFDFNCSQVSSPGVFILHTRQLCVRYLWQVNSNGPRTPTQYLIPRSCSLPHTLTQDQLYLDLKYLGKPSASWLTPTHLRQVKHIGRDLDLLERARHRVCCGFLRLQRQISVSTKNHTPTSNQMLIRYSPRQPERLIHRGLALRKDTDCCPTIQG